MTTAARDKHEIELTLYRGLNGTNPSAFRIDADGLSVFERPLDGYRFNLTFQAIYTGDKTPGIIAELTHPMLSGGVAEFTPEFGEGHWSIRFPGLEITESRNLLSKYAKSMLK
ncbi:MAG: hypothetical protein KF855_06045 [Acidobacteria bacterium]|nr:hypothetical protein [Acidobacteriota bacterium]